MDNSKIDYFPIYYFQIEEEYEEKIFDYLNDKSKLILTLRILKINKITKKELIDFSLEFIRQIADAYSHRNIPFYKQRFL